MLFAIGTKVQFRYTGERGVISARLEGDMLQVRLDNQPGMEIPAFEEDLIRDEDAEPVLAGAKFIQGKQEKKPEAPPRRSIISQYHILKPKGVQLAFEPMPGRDGVVTRYKAWLVNDTQHEFLIEFDLFTDDRDAIILDDKLSRVTALELGDLLYDDLSAHPEAVLTVRRITTEGTDEPISKSLKIKPKQFFNHLQTAPILNLMAYQFVMIDSFEPLKSDQVDGLEDLKNYTKQHARQPRNTSTRGTRASSHIEEFAHFEPEIDLHIDKLLNGHARLDKGEILRIQLQHMHRFLDKSAQLGVTRVHIIHGMGEGKLRDAVSQELKQRGDVIKFKNEYHIKYGYGATEVWLT
jgi:hypothetical protein